MEYGLPPDSPDSPTLSERIRDEEEFNVLQDEELLAQKQQPTAMEFDEEEEEEDQDPEYEVEAEEEDGEYDDSSAHSPDRSAAGNPYGVFQQQQPAARGGRHFRTPVQPNAPTDVPVRVDASCMRDYRAEHLGEGITPGIPYFAQGQSKNGMWMSYKEAGQAMNGFKPVRAQGMIFPAKLFSPDATRFRHMMTPTEGTQRAQSICALASMQWTPTSKGFM